jgi:hypothetical protein
MRDDSPVVVVVVIAVDMIAVVILVVNVDAIGAVVLAVVDDAINNVDVMDDEIVGPDVIAMPMDA